MAQVTHETANFRFYVLRWWLVVGLAVLTAAAAVWISNRTLLAHERQVQASLAAYGTLTEIQDLVSTLKDAETGQRGYLLTGDADYLEPYEAATRSVPLLMSRIVTLTQDNAAARKQMRQVSQLSEQKLGELRESVRLRQSQGPAAALRIVNSGRGERITDQLGVAIANLQEEIRLNLHQAIESANRAESNAMWMIRGGYGVLIVFFVLATLVISRNFRHRLAAEENERQAKLEMIAERRYRDLLEAAPDGILEVDSEGSIVLANPVVERLFGYSRQELLGKSVDQLVPEHLAARHATHRSQYQRSPVTRPMGSGLELHGLRKDGALFPVEISLSPLSSSSGMRISAIIRDVSERKSAEERMRAIQEEFTARLSAANRELETRNREIEQANRLKSEFLANMSHELRTPLHTVIGFSELLSEEAKGPLNNDQKRFVGHIHKDAHHLLELINDLLDLSKIEAGKLQLRFETLDLCDVVDDALSSIRPQGAAKSIRIETRLPGSMSVEGDRLRLRQVLINLLSNAVKFTPEGGHVSVEGAPVGELAQVSVIDTGIGIPPNEQESVFDKFHQANSNASGRHEGTGLGLTITRQLVEEHGGRIGLRSEPGKGSCFTFTIPLKRNSE